MGLDMYAYAVDASKLNDDDDIDVEMGDHAEKIAYWRKFNHLHGWMEQLYREKGGEQEFNCTTVRLTLDDLERLENEAEDPELFHSVQGFFFGGDELHHEDMESLEAFIDKAKDLIKNQGMAIFYDSWW